LTYTTLNEKLGIQAGVAIPSGSYPTVAYYSVGNGGHTFSAGQSGIPFPELYQHQPSDAALFNHMPFVLRQQNNDLIPAQRANYALRKEITIGSTVYIAYYLRRIDMTAVSVTLQHRVDHTNYVTSNAFTPTADNLSPTPTILSNSNVNTVSGDYLVASAPLTVSMTADDVTEYLNAAQILYGDQNYAIISEMALCSGYDKTITISASTGAFNFNEAILVQPVAFIADFQMLQYANQGLNKTLDSGGNCPLFVISQGV
jgi:hypothetical protein